MVYAADPRSNRLLAALPRAELGRWLPHLEWVRLPLGQMLHESGRAMSHAYFPTTAIVSLQAVTEDGGSDEIAAVGNEGLVGIELFTGGQSTPSRAMVRNAGQGFRLHAHVLKHGFECAGATNRLLLRYTQALIAQMAQTVACNRFHSLDQQLCRLLLLSLDRLEGDELEMTQDLIASLLGVRRESVTTVAFRLQSAGLISYSRGHITVLDRAGLEMRSCECYAAVKREHDRLLPEERAPQSEHAVRRVCPAWADARADRPSRQEATIAGAA